MNMKFKNFNEYIKKIFKKANKRKEIKFLFPVDKKVKLEIMGISYVNSVEQKIYVVILGETNGPRKVPVVVNYYEAQSIAIEVEKISPMVPLIYDVFRNIIINNKINFSEILITDYKNEILSTHLLGDNQTFEIRTADALALSVRLGYPIQIYDSILSVVDEHVQKYYDIKSSESEQVVSVRNGLEGFSLKELELLLKKSIDDEEYEKASELRDEINKRRKNNL